MSKLNQAPAAPAMSSGKAAWSTPGLRRLEAGSAEAGANPVVPEGAFQGS